VGPNDDELGPRFPPTSNAYPRSLRNCAKKAATELKHTFLVPHGTYCFVSGPMYESRAECRFLRSLGGDAVGMSTVPEIVAAHHCNMQILCLSLITNKVDATGDEDVSTHEHGPVANHEEVLAAAQGRAQDMLGLVKKTVDIMAKEVLPQLPDLPKVSLAVPERSLYKDKKFSSLTLHIGSTAVLIGAGALVGIALSRKR